MMKQQRPDRNETSGPEHHQKKTRGHYEVDSNFYREMMKKKDRRGWSWICGGRYWPEVRGRRLVECSLECVCVHVGSGIWWVTDDTLNKQVCVHDVVQRGSVFTVSVDAIRVESGESSSVVSHASLLRNGTVDGCHHYRLGLKIQFRTPTVYVAFI